MTEDEFEEALESLIERSRLPARALAVVFGEMKDRYADLAALSADAPAQPDRWTGKAQTDAEQQ